MKIKAPLCLCLLAGAFAVRAQAQDPKPAAAPPPSADAVGAASPQAVGRNLLPGHADILFYPSLDLAYKNASDFLPLAERRKASSWYYSLNGKWRFKWSATAAEIPADFQRTAFLDRDWEEIAVPSNVELSGHGVPVYVKSMTDDRHSPWGKMQPPLVPAARNPVSLYRRRFIVPSAWKGRRVVIHFDGVEPAFRLWLNGKLVGEGADGRTPAEFDLTSFVESGDNILAVEVPRYSAGSYIEDQNRWRLSGIFRDVYLYSPGPLHVSDAFVKSGLDAAYKDGVFDLHAVVRNEGKATTNTTLEIVLRDDAGRTVLGPATLSQAIGAGKEADFDIQNAGKLTNIHAWSAESPYLYTLLATLRETAGGKVVETFPMQIGFRTSEIKNGQWLLNGKPVVVKGVNRQASDPEGGDAVSRQTMVKDLELIKRANLNAVRTNNSPNDPEWQALCDAYGVYIVDEANADAKELDPAKGVGGASIWKEARLDRAERLLQRDKNHPSVVFWSPGGAGDAGDLDAASALLKKLDPTRPVFRAGASGTNQRDIDAPYFPTAESLAKRAAAKPDKPLILAAFAGVAGNSTGALQATWDAYEKIPGFQGGFIADWADQGLLDHDKAGLAFFAHAGDYPGDVALDGNGNGAGLINPDRTPRPALEEVEKVFQGLRIESSDPAAGKIRVTNRNAFLNAQQFVGFYRETVDGASVENGRLAPLKLEPGESKDFQLPLRPLALHPGQQALLTIVIDSPRATRWSPAGASVASQQFVVGSKPRESVAEATTAFGPPPLDVRQNPGSINVQGADFAIAIGTASGGIESLTHHAHRLIASPLVPNFWRAPTDNDEATSSETHAAAWKDAAAKRKIDSVSVLPAPPNSTSVTVEVKGSMLDGKCPFALAYQILPGGAVHVRETINPDPALPDLPRVGMLMAIPGIYERVGWLGRGPGENYADRNDGTTIGRYESDVADFGFNYVRPQANGNRSDVRWAAWTDNSGNGIMAVAGERPLNVSAHRYSLAELDAARRSSDLTRNPFNTIEIDGWQQGVGGESSGAAGVRPLPEFRLPAKTYSFDFELVPLDGLKTKSNQYDALSLTPIPPLAE